ncbi:MAG: hypothetical protein E6Q97_01615 [Desulfurellales bacterium]|nr:MAG: hypothetical protein E6Q97_01615 [Desulfurellales bacterium]
MSSNKGKPTMENMSTAECLDWCVKVIAEALQDKNNKALLDAEKALQEAQQHAQDCVVEHARTTEKLRLARVAEIEAGAKVDAVKRDLSLTEKKLEVLNGLRRA